MHLTGALRVHMLTLDPVTALVASRIRLFKIRQSEPTFPVVRLQDIGQFQRMHHRGALSVKNARVQVDSIAMEGNGIDVESVAWAVDQAILGPGDGSGLLGFKGDIGSPSVRIYSVIDGGALPGYDAQELKQFKVMRNYLIEFADLSV